ncbi:MAG: hypothetical protein R3C56_33000 [Pirellulaceae bacterium]
MHVVFGANIDLQGGKYGNAVLSRYPIKSSKNHVLPNVGAVSNAVCWKSMWNCRKESS